MRPGILASFAVGQTDEAERELGSELAAASSSQTALPGAEKHGVRIRADLAQPCGSSLPYLPLNAVLVWSRCGLGEIGREANSRGRRGN